MTSSASAHAEVRTILWRTVFWYRAASAINRSLKLTYIDEIIVSRLKIAQE